MLIDERDNLKIADFGVSDIIAGQQDLFTNNVGSKTYMVKFF